MDGDTPLLEGLAQERLAGPPDGHSHCPRQTQPHTYGLAGLIEDGEGSCSAVTGLAARTARRRGSPGARSMSRLERICASVRWGHQWDKV